MNSRNIPALALLMQVMLSSHALSHATELARRGPPAPQSYHLGDTATHEVGHVKRSATSDAQPAQPRASRSPEAGPEGRAIGTPSVDTGHDPAGKRQSFFEDVLDGTGI